MICVDCFIFIYDASKRCARNKTIGIERTMKFEVKVSANTSLDKVSIKRMLKKCTSVLQLNQVCSITCFLKPSGKMCRLLQRKCALHEEKRVKYKITQI